jgi:hypothetical protein
MKTTTKTTTRNERWMIGGLVTVCVDGTPMQGRILSSPMNDDEAWTEGVCCDAWIVSIADFGIDVCFAVSNRKAIAELDAATTSRLLERRGVTR